MQGALIISHGELADGFLSAIYMLMGDDIPQLESVALRENDSTEDFSARLAEALGRVDMGDGAVIFADLYGGTPCNLSNMVMSDKVRIFAGVNLAVLAEFISMRDSNVDLDELADTGRSAIRLPEIPSCTCEQDDEL